MNIDTALAVIEDSARYFRSPHGEPLVVLEEAHHAQLTLCEMLEHIADSIPEQIDRHACRTLADNLATLISDIHTFEEDVLFPLVVDRFGATRSIDQTIMRLKYEHCEDACFAEELTEALRELGTKKTLRNPEATGYMLRGFFEAMRRHIAFEREHLGQLLR